MAGFNCSAGKSAGIFSFTYDMMSLRRSISLFFFLLKKRYFIASVTGVSSISLLIWREGFITSSLAATGLTDGVGDDVGFDCST